MSTQTVYIQNLGKKTYAALPFDPSTRRLLKPLPKGFEPDPWCQIERMQDGRMFAIHGGTDMPPWLLATNRRAAGLSQVKLAMLVGVNPRTVCVWEKGHHPLSRKYAGPLYRALAVDHRPAPIEPVILRKTHRYLGMNSMGLAPLLRIHTDDVRGLMAGTMPPDEQMVLRFYALYCMLPDLTDWPL